MAAEPLAPDPDPHTTAGKLAELRAPLRRGGARRLGARRREAARQGQEDRPRADRRAARRGLVRRVRRVRPAPLDQRSAWTSNRPFGDGVVTGYGTVDGRPVCVFSQDVTVFGGALGEVYGEKIVKVLDFAMRTGCPVDRHQRGRRRADPGGRRLARPVRRDLLPQRAGLRRHPADLADHGRGRRRARLLPRADRLHRDGRQDLADVHHRPGRRARPSPARTSRSRNSAAPARTTPPAATRTTSAPTRTTRSTTSRRCCPTCRSNNLDPLPVYDSGSRPTTSTTTTRSSTRSSRTRPTSPTTCTQIIEHLLDDGEFLEVHALFAQNIIVRLRPDRGPSGRRGGQPADALRRLPGHRRLGEGGAVRAHLRRVQRAGADPGRRARASCPASTRRRRASSGAARS